MAPSLKSLPAWADLERLYQDKGQKLRLRSLFANDKQRFSRYSVDAMGGEFFLDYSKNIVDDEVMKSLLALAEQRHLKQKIEAMYRGDKINFTEGRAVSHVALRHTPNNPNCNVLVEGKDVSPLVQGVLEKMSKFCERVRSGEWKGSTGLPITDIVNIGIGGSDLGPKMICNSLKAYSINKETNKEVCDLMVNICDHDAGA